MRPAATCAAGRIFCVEHNNNRVRITGPKIYYTIVGLSCQYYNLTKFTVELPAVHSKKSGRGAPLPDLISHFVLFVSLCGIQNASVRLAIDLHGDLYCIMCWRLYGLYSRRFDGLCISVFSC